MSLNYTKLSYYPRDDYFRLTGVGHDRDKLQVFEVYKIIEKDRGIYAAKELDRAIQNLIDYIDSTNIEPDTVTFDLIGLF